MKKKELNLKYKLLLFLYSIDENENQILYVSKAYNTIEHNLETEINVLKELRQKKKNIENLEKLKNMKISVDMKYNIEREIAIVFFKNKKYDDCLKYLEICSNSNNIIQKYRAILDYCYVFNRKYITNKNKIYIKKEINENYELIKNNIKSLNKIMKNPSQKEIYYEAFNLKKKTYDLLEPDIIMLNSNPIKNISKDFSNILNTQYYILKQLKREIQSHIRIKSNILNEANLYQALNEEKGEILIIQSDDYIKSSDIICESAKGESRIIIKEKLINNLKNNQINFKVIILCFPNSSSFKDYLQKNNVKYQYIITFENYNNYSYELIRDFNKISIQFIIDFIRYSVYFSNNIENIFKALKISYKNNNESKYFKITFGKHFDLCQKNIILPKINYHKEIEENELYLYDSLLGIDEIDTINNNIYNYSKNILFN